MRSRAGATPALQNNVTLDNLRRSADAFRRTDKRIAMSSFRRVCVLSSLAVATALATWWLASRRASVTPWETLAAAPAGIRWLEPRLSRGVGGAPFARTASPRPLLRPATGGLPRHGPDPHS